MKIARTCRRGQLRHDEVPFVSEPLGQEGDAQKHHLFAQLLGRLPGVYVPDGVQHVHSESCGPNAGSEQVASSIRQNKPREPLIGLQQLLREDARVSLPPSPFRAGQGRA